MFKDLNRSLMRRFFVAQTIFWFLALSASGQSYLTPEYGYEVTSWFEQYPNVGAFDISDTLIYLSDGDTIHKLDIHSGTELKKYGVPEDYTSAHYVSFLTVSPDGSTLWTGYTSDGNLDDRIYSIETEGGAWELQTLFPGNMDLEFWNDSILVSGLNSTSWETPNGIYLLDTSGNDQHRLVIDVGGYSSGMAMDAEANLYYGTSSGGGADALYRWDSLLLKLVIEDPQRPLLQVSNGKKLTDLPAGAYDCEVDEGGNVLFTMNSYGGTQIVGRWDGNEGDGMHFDTLATAAGEWDWLGIIRSKGDILLAEPDHFLVTYSFGQPLVKLTRLVTAGPNQERPGDPLIYPNPTKGSITIRTEDPDRMGIQLYTLQGSLVSRWKDLESGTRIDISGQPAGSYILKITGPAGIMTRIIQKL
jgi:hypothetical protein